MADFYAIELFVDAFGNDTYVESIHKTEQDAKEYIEKNPYTFSEYDLISGEIIKELEYSIVEGYFGKHLDNVYD